MKNRHIIFQAITNDKYKIYRLDKAENPRLLKKEEFVREAPICLKCHFAAFIAYESHIRKDQENDSKIRDSLPPLFMRDIEIDRSLGWDHDIKGERIESYRLACYCTRLSAYMIDKRKICDLWEKYDPERDALEAKAEEIMRKNAALDPLEETEENNEQQ